MPTPAPTPAPPVHLTPVPTPATVVALVHVVVRLLGVTCEAARPRFSAAVAEAVPGFFSANDVDVQACHGRESNDPFSFGKQPDAMVNFTLSLSAVFCNAGGHFTASVCASRASARHLVQARAFSHVLGMNLGLHEERSGRPPVQLVSAQVVLLLTRKTHKSTRVGKVATLPPTALPTPVAPTAKSVAAVRALRHRLSRHQAQQIRPTRSDDHRKGFVTRPPPVMIAVVGTFVVAILVAAGQWRQRRKRLTSSTPVSASANADEAKSSCSREEKSLLLQQAESSDGEDDPWLRGEHPRGGDRSKSKSSESEQLSYELAYEYDDDT